jgi:RNA polymerase-interacting CarD/CdnL/TRCF family regulator
MSKKKQTKKATKSSKPAKTAKKAASKVKKITKRPAAAHKAKPAKKAKPAAKPAKKSIKPAKAAKPSEKAPAKVAPAKPAKAPGYKVGDVLFYPRQGLCKFERVVNELGMDFFLLKPVNGPGHATIRVPIMNAEKVGLRRPSSTMTFDAACAYLKKLPSDFETDWRKRNQLLTDQTMRGLTTDLLSASKILAIQDAVKPLSHQERRQYEQIVQFAADEIAMVEQRDGASIALQLMEYMKNLVARSKPVAVAK